MRTARWFQTVPIFIARMDTTRTLDVEGTSLALRAATFFPSTRRMADGTFPSAPGRGRSTARARSTAGRVGSGALVSPAAAEGKLVVFTVPVSATTGRRDWRFHTFGPLTQYAGAAGIAAVALDVVPRVTARTAARAAGVRWRRERPSDADAALAADHARRGARAVRRRVARRAHRRTGRSHRQGQRRVRRRARAASRRGT